jgi:hypothetical protein
VIEASCHCGAVRIEVPRAPDRVTDCNCSICRSLGVLWAYYPPTEVTIQGPPDGIVAYVRSDLGEPAGLAFHHCRVCGCTTHWRSFDPARDDRMGVNARLMDPEAIKGARVRKLDGAVTWTYVDEEASPITPSSG